MGSYCQPRSQALSSHGLSASECCQMIVMPAYNPLWGTCHTIPPITNKSTMLMGLKLGNSRLFSRNFNAVCPQTLHHLHKYATRIPMGVGVGVGGVLMAGGLGSPRGVDGKQACYYLVLLPCKCPSHGAGKRCELISVGRFCSDVISVGTGERDCG